MRDNAEILATRLAAFNQRPGPRVGDFLKLDPPDPRCPGFTRFTHDWGASIQTGGNNGSYYLGNGYLSYSGSLDPGLPTADLLPTDETRDGRLWFFDGDIPGAGRGADFSVPMRVYAPRPGADLSGVWELKCPWWLTVRHEAQNRFCIEYRCTPRTAFDTEAELRTWIAAERLVIPQPLTPGTHFALAWPKA